MRAILILGLLLGGCAVGASGLRGLDNYVGRDARDVFAVIGYPDRQEIVAGNTVYHWGTDLPDGPSCTVKIVADPSGRVLQTDAYGNAIGCDRYASGLKRALKK